jgi:hypothetical protein
MSTSDAKSDVSRTEELLRAVLPPLSVDSLLRFRDATVKIHSKRMEMINAELAKKGYVEPHLVGTKEHSPE